MQLVYLLILLPLIGFLVNGLFGSKLSKTVSGWLGSLVVLASFAISTKYFLDFYTGSLAAPIDIKAFEILYFQNISIHFGILVDQLSVLWLMIVTGIGFLIHVYSIGYMHDDENFSRFFAYLNLFIFFMLLLVLGNNLLVTYAGWEGVSLCSYFLVGFWYKNESYSNAGKKAFIVNRVGDLGFLLAMFVLLYYVGSLNFSDLKAEALGGNIPSNVALAAALFLFVGAAAKSAQIPLYTWLPDAMAGPTPVSALIHAATMVTAGIYLVVRTNFLYDLAPEAMQVVAVVGAATALFAATIGIFQNDIKKVLAYSTVSQLGLMFLAVGVGAYTAAVFHVITHAFFKACLFLGSGSVIHALHGEQDIRNMGGLKKWMPITFVTFLISSLAISGIPPFSGFFSKDEILAAAYEHNIGLWLVASLASLFTAFYMFRLVFLTFNTNFRGTEEQQKHLHESPSLITIPLIILAALAVVGGAMGIPEVFGGTHWMKNFLAPVVASGSGAAHAISHSTELMLISIASIAAVVGIAFAYFRFVKGGALPLKDGEEKGLQKVIYNKFYVDEIYNAIIVKPLMTLSSLAYEIFDVLVVDGVVNTLASITYWKGKQIRLLQSGNIGFYLIMMVLGACAILGITIWQL
ncbi:MAG: NADH-quinone oxidoreductase subunit L [Chitinophagales bacterium]|nr:NADH-quinone oxidoreductase subunit L [Chitinophagales bacterium]HRP38569.1 NADH-quinone oxidoreductase subunit L [Chitinophagales bacterium]